MNSKGAEPALEQGRSLPYFSAATSARAITK
jgi:hypothetical protein